MKKKLLLTSLVIFIGILLFGVLNASAETSGYFTYTVSNGEATITNFDSSVGGEILIPSTIGEYPVTNIDGAFYLCFRLTKVTIPSSVENISSGSFGGCYCLIEVDRDNPYYTAIDGYLYDKDVTTLIQAINGINCVIPDSVTIINDYAFAQCYSNNIIIPDGVKSIGHGAFSQNYNLKSITIPSSVEFLGNNAFYMCNKLENIYYEGTEDEWNELLAKTGQSISSNTKLTTIEASGVCGENLTWVLDNHGTLTISGQGEMYSYENQSYTWHKYIEQINSLVIENGVTSIGHHAFQSLVNLKDASLPDTMEHISEYAFSRCKSLSKINIPEKVTIINDYTFSYCESLTSITINNNVTSIGSNAFSYCYGLSTLEIPDSVECVGESAFASCNINSITIGKGIKYVGKWAFSFMTDPNETVNVYIGDIVKWCSIKFENEYSNPLANNGILYLNNEIVNTIVFPESVTCVGNYAFYNCKNITEIVLHDKILNIGIRAFSACPKLKKAIINGSVSIGEEAFFASGLANIYFNSGIVKSGKSSFYNCSSLKNVYITDISKWFDAEFESSSANPLYNGARLYLNNEYLNDVVVPQEITEVDNSVFYNCINLHSITIHENVVNIEPASLFGCTSLKEINVSENNSYYTSENGILYDKNKVKLLLYPAGNYMNEYRIPQGVECIGTNAFRNSKIKVLTLPDSLTSIEYGAFYNADYITCLIIPDSVIDIGDYAFYDCSSLKSLTLPTGIVTINSQMFRYCDKLTSVTMPSTVKSISSNSFRSCSKLTDIYFRGTSTEWADIAIDETNNNLANATIHYEYAPKGIIANGLCGINLSWELDSFGNLSIRGTGNMSNYTSLSRAPWYTIKDYFNSLSIEEGVTSIGNRAFYGIDEITDISIPDGVISVGESAFYECINIPRISLPNSINSIGSYAFYSCINMSELSFGNSLVNISSSAFSNCDSLIYLTIDSASHIGDMAFAICDNLTAIKIGCDVESIGYGVFQGCSSLVEITVDKNNPYYLSHDGNLFNKDRSILIQYATGKSDFSFQIPNDVTEIASNAFNGCKYLENVFISEGVTTLGNQVFAGCSVLKAISIPASTENVGWDIVFGSNNLKAIYYYSNPTDWEMLNSNGVYIAPTEMVVFVKHTKTNISDNRKTFTITPVNVEAGKTVILALYQGNQFVEMQNAIYKLEALTFTTTKEYDVVKIMVWEDLTDLTPVTQPEII